MFYLLVPIKWKPTRSSFCRCIVWQNNLPGLRISSMRWTRTRTRTRTRSWSRSCSNLDWGYPGGDGEEGILSTGAGRDGGRFNGRSRFHDNTPFSIRLDMVSSIKVKFVKLIENTFIWTCRVPKSRLSISSESPDIYDKW